jgi:hypothetical protein
MHGNAAEAPNGARAQLRSLRHVRWLEGIVGWYGLASIYRIVLNGEWRTGSLVQPPSSNGLSIILAASIRKSHPSFHRYAPTAIQQADTAMRKGRCLGWTAASYLAMWAK